MLCDSELQLWLDDMHDNAVLFDCALTKSSQLLRCVGFPAGCAGIVQHGRGIHEGEMDSDSQQHLDLVLVRRRDDSDETRRGDDAATMRQHPRVGGRVG